MHFIISNLPVNNKRLKQFKEKTQKDPIFQKTQKDPIFQTLLKSTIGSWSEKTFIPHQLRPYFTHHSDISYHEALLLKDQQIIVPSSL